MINQPRNRFNEAFTEEKYQAFVQDLDTSYNHKITFRIAETPVFIPQKLTEKLIEASNQIIDFICQPDFKEITKNAVPAHLNVPNEDEHTLFLALDYAVCADENGELTPQLIEMQGFPSLFGYQDFVANKFREHFDIPQNYTHLGSNLTSQSYRERMKNVILGGYNAENVVLLEIEPEKQNTAIDFYVSKDFFDVSAICISKVMLEDNKLFYLNNGVKTRINRIYNRVIFDELVQRTDLNLSFDLTQNVEVEWAGHPNWFFRISKYTMPFIQSQYVPHCDFLDKIVDIPQDLENYVLKPLFSFSGAGVKFHVTESDILEVPADQKHNFMLQKKVKYHPVVPDPEGELVKTEIRLLYVWEKGEPRPKLFINLVRLSRGEMIGVKYNKNKTWVGGTCGFFEK